MPGAAEAVEAVARCVRPVERQAVDVEGEPLRMRALLDPMFKADPQQLADALDATFAESKPARPADFSRTTADLRVLPTAVEGS